MTTSRDPEVFAGIASVGHRSDLLRKTVASLIDQVDRIGVYLNNYEDVPKFLDHPRIVVARSQDQGDLRDNGKFFFLDGCRHRYYAAADDDLLYPPDYISRLRTVLADAGPGAAVGVHGAVYPSRVIGLSKPRHLYHFLDSLPYVMPAHLLGTGTILFDREEWQLRFEEFGEPGMADVWFARSARTRGARLFTVNRNRNWIVDLQGAESTSTESQGVRLFAEAKADDSHQVSLLKEGRVSDGGFKRLVGDLTRSEEFAGDLSLSQAIAFDDVRRTVGWRPLDPIAAEKLRTRVEKARPDWDRSLIDVDAYTAAAVGILTNDLTADIVERTIETMERINSVRVADMPKWKQLPYPIRFDTRESRLERLNDALLRSAFFRSADDARSLWSRVGESIPDLSVDLALAAEQARLDTGFQRLPALRRAARKNHVGAALHLRQYLETHGWAQHPHVLSWKKTFGDSFFSKEVQLLLCMTALRSGNRQMASTLAGFLAHRWPADFDVKIMQAVVAGAGGDGHYKTLSPALAVLDGILQDVGLRGFTEVLVEDDTTHWMDLFRTPLSEQSPGSPLVTVVLTVHNDASTVKKAIRSVLASADVSLELIVVDDASDDGTADVVDEMDDSRMRVIRNIENLGPYLSRNRALEIASGELVTIADADDWCHPDRLRYQVERMNAEPSLLACNTAHMRVRADGQADLENNLHFMGHGPVSLMFRRSVVDQIGGFDHVRTRGDVEFIRRIKARFGHQALASFEVPLILATSSPHSNSKRFSADALRRYRQAMRQWHTDNAVSDALYVPLSGDRATFVAPEELTA